MTTWAITTGCERTRRKRFCYVTNPAGEVTYSHRQIWPCIEHLDALDVEEYIIRPDSDRDDGRPYVTVDRRRDLQWQKLQALS